MLKAAGDKHLNQHGRLTYDYLLAAFSPSTSGNGLLWTLPRTRVRLRPLAMDRQVAAMPQAAVAANLRKPLDVHCNFTAQITLDDKVSINRLPQTCHFRFG
jgi:hypothetical protein